MQLSINEVFAVRDGEKVSIVEDRPTSGRYLAVMVRSVEMPPGDREAVRVTDGKPVEMAAILACEMNRRNGYWQWTQLSPPTKENIGDLMLESNCEKDRWYFVVVAD